MVMFGLGLCAGLYKHFNLDAVKGKPVCVLAGPLCRSLVGLVDSESQHMN